MASTGKTALVFGGTGLVGSNLLNLLLKENDYSKLKSFVRKKSEINNQKLEEYIIDFNNLSSSKTLFTGDDIFCCLGTTIKKAGSKEAFKKVDYQFPLEIAQLSLQNNVKQYLIISSIGADLNSRFFYSKIKGEVESAISSLNFPALHIFRPSLLLGERNEFRLGEKIGEVLSKTFSFAFIGKLKKYKAIEAKIVAAAMISSALNNSSGKNIYESDEIKKIGQKYLESVT